MDQKEEEEVVKAYNRCRDLISALPSDGDCPCLRHYNGVYLDGEILLKILLCQQNFVACPTDIILATYPKSGTTWLKAMAFAILNRRRDPPFSNLHADHPLLSIHPQRAVHYLEELYRTPDQLPSQLLDALPSPRMFSTHCPYSLLPDSITATDCASRIVYLCRDPKDVLVSMWHFFKKIGNRSGMGFPHNYTLDYLSDLFCSGKMHYGSVWDHRGEYWQESSRRPEKVLFLEYEDMLQRPEENARTLAEFIGRPFSEEEENAGVVGDIVKLCSIEFLKGLDVNREGVMPEWRGWIIESSAFFRVGKAGGWKEELTPEIAEKVDRITAEKMAKYCRRDGAM